MYISFCGKIFKYKRTPGYMKNIFQDVIKIKSFHVK